MDLAEVHKLCVEEIRYHAGFLAGGLPIRDYGEAIEELSRLFQGLGICHLLEALNTDEFRENLVRSGHARRYYLHASRTQGNTDSKYLALSRSEALLDVMAAGDLLLARSIAELSVTEWTQRWEYEDDFCFYFFLQQLVLDAPPEDLRQIVRRFETALQGGTSSRQNVMKALVERDTEGFEAGLTALLDEEQNRIDSEREDIVDSKFLFWPRSFVSIEALALLRAAGLVGLVIEKDFPMCPPEARLSIGECNYRDLFAELGEVLSA
jgi:Immunity protein 49